MTAEHEVMSSYSECYGSSTNVCVQLVYFNYIRTMVSLLTLFWKGGGGGNLPQQAVFL